MTNLTPVDPPSLAPLTASAEENQLESELKQVFLTVFGNLVRERERALNLYGMAHLGEEELVQRNLQSDGLALIRQDAARMRFLLKAWRARNPERGVLFLKKYLQTVWPNEWSIDQFWHPIATAIEYPEHKTVDGDPETHFLTSRVRVGVSVAVDDGTGLIAMQKALRSTLAARLVLEMVLMVEMANEVRLASAAAVVMPMYVRGTLRGPGLVARNNVSINGALGIRMPVRFVGKLTL
jgi:hypothetical protein